MRVVIIGSGNVASVIGRRAKATGHEIIQVAGRNSNAVNALAEELGCAAVSDLAAIDKTGDIFICAVADEAIGNLKEKLNVGDKFVVHTAGSVSKDILKGTSANYGVLYPLQSLRKENTNNAIAIPLLIDGNNEHSIYHIGEFAKSLSNTVSYADDDNRLKLHTAAVITNNFTNHLYCMAKELCDNEKVDFKMLVPLIEETATRLYQFSPCDVQTGPAARKDTSTLDKHLRLLTTYPKLRTLYLRMTDSIMNP